MFSRGRSCRVLSLARVISTALLLAFAWAFPTPILAASQPGLGPGGPLPLAFEPNQGQADPAVKFLARGPGYGLFFAPGQTVLVLMPAQPGSTSRRPGASLASRVPSVVRMRLVGADATAPVTGLEPLPARSHYLVGERGKWVRNVSTFGRIRYADVYPGVSLVFYGSDRQLEYDFVVAPGADPGAVALSFDGADAVRLDDGGDLVVTTAAGELRLRRPVIYEEDQGGRRPLDGGYVVDGTRVRFQVAGRDASRSLVIDPVLGYSSFLGGSASDQGFGIAFDTAGNAYVTGATASANFPVSATPSQQSLAALTDAFVTKIDASGAVVYSTYIGGTGDDAGHGIAVDATGNAYVTGVTTSSNFPSVGPFQPTLQGGSDAFVAKVDVTGSSLVYSTFLGGEADDFGFGIALDGGGNAYVTGSTASATFPNNGAVTCAGSRSGATDAFIAKVSAAGTALGYCAFVGGSGDDSAAAIAADLAGNVWIAGSTTSNDLPVVGGVQAASGGGTDAFVGSLDPGGTVVYLTYLGGAGEDHATALAVDVTGNAYVTGSTTSFNFPTAAPMQDTLRGGGTDAFVAKLTPAGDALVFSTYLGGSGADVGNGVAVNPLDGSVYVAGSTNSGDFPTQSAIQDRLNGGLDVFVAKLDPTGSFLVYSTYLGGMADDVAFAVAVDTNGVAFVTGATASPTFPVTPGQTLAGSVDAFVTQIGDGGIIQFSGNTYRVAENAGSVTISVQRTGDTSAQVSVDYVTSDGTATADADYLGTSGTLTFGSGQIIATFTMTILDDTIGDGDETVNLRLSNPTGGAVLGARRTATLTIVDDEPAINFSASSYNVQENKGPAVVTVTRSGPATGTVTVRVSTSDGTATAPADYLPINSTVTFAPGVRSVNVPVTIVNDTLAETTEIINLTLSNVSGGTPPAVLGVRSSATINIFDDDRGGTVQFSKPVFTINEPTTGTALATITVTRAGGAASGVTVDYEVSDGLPPGGASNGRNYTATSGTLSFGVGQMSKTFTVTVRGDATATGDLSALLSLTRPTGGAVLGSTQTAELRIVDSAPRFSFATDAFTVREGTPTATITVLRTGPAPAAATVDFTTIDGSAVAGVDYQAVAGTLTFAAGAVTKTFTVPILNDSLATGSRTVLLTLGNPTPATVSIVPPAQATLTITDNDAGGVIEFAGPVFVYPQSAGAGTVTVTRSGGGAGSVTVQFATSNGTGVAGTDYTATSGTLTFGPGETTKTFTVPLLTPPTAAGVRSVNLGLSAPGGGATLGPRPTAVLRIVDQLSLAFTSATYSVTEGGTATISVELSGMSAAPVMVDYLASDGSAKQPADYRPTTGTLTFPAGGVATSVRTQAFTVPVLQNTLADGTKTVNLSLSNPVGATLVTAPINRSTAVLSIIDDDQGGALAFESAKFSVFENAGPAVIRVRRSSGTAGGVTVDYATSDGSAVSGVRYQPTAGQLTFGAGEMLKTFTVPVVNDAVGQGSQTVNVRLSNPGGGGALGGQSTAVLTIQDDDPYVSLSAATYAVPESAGSLTVTVVRGGDLSQQATVQYATAEQAPASATHAVAGVHYTDTSGTLTFAPGSTTATFSVPILDNSLPQADRTFVVALSNPLLAPPAPFALIAPAAAVVTIKDDDIGGTIQFSAPNFSVNEDGGEAILTVTRTGGRAGGVSVRLRTGDLFSPPIGTPAQTATVGTDYTSTDVRVTFGPGDTTKTVRIPILTDAASEGDETLYVQLSDPQPAAATGAPLIGSQALTTVTIVDAQPTVQFPAATVNATEGQPVATVTVHRTGPAGRLSVDFATSDGTATAPAYYLSTGGTLVFEAGVTSQSFTVPLVDNQAIEADRQFNVTLSNLVALTPAAAGTFLGPRTTVSVLIKDNDRGGMFTVTGGAITEGGQNQNSVFLATVARTDGSGGPVTVTFHADQCGAFGSFCNFPARPNTDFDVVNTVLTFQPGEMSKTVPLIVHGNNIPEGSRDIQVTISNPLPAVTQDGKQIGPVIVTSEALVRIVEDDLYFVFLSSETYATAEAAREFRATVRRTGLPTVLSGSLTVDMVAVAGVGTPAQDYISLGVFDGQSSLVPGAPGFCGFLAGGNVVARQNVVFSPGQDAQTFRVPFLDDTVVDGPKSIIICLNDAENTNTPGGPGIAFPAAALLTVNDDDVGGVIEFGSDTYVVSENAGQAIITLVRPGGANLASNVTVIARTGDLFAPTTPPQTGAAGVDYSSTNVVVTFNAGETTASFAVPVLDDGVADGGKFVNLQISNPQPGGGANRPALGTRKTAVLRIVDATQSVDFALANYDVPEAAGVATIVLERGGDVSAPLTVDFATADNTAFDGVDYTAVSTTVTFAAGSRTATVPVPLIDNKVVAADKVVDLTLSNPGPGYTIPAGRGAATLTLKDDDVAGVISFAAGTYTALEPTGPAGVTGTATITVVRTGGTAGCPLPLGPAPSCPDATLVRFQTANGTATAGVNYTATDIQVEFGAGETAKTVTVPLRSDGVVGGTKTVSLSLGTPLPAGFLGRSPTLGSTTAATLQIVETEIRIGATSYAVSENGGQARLTVVRTGSLVGTTTVDVATVDGAALGSPTGAAADYRTTATTLTFAPGETVQTLDVTLTEDALFEGDESFDVVFSNVSGATIARETCASATPAAPALVATCTVNIVVIDNDAGGVVEFSQDTFDVVENVAGGNATVTIKRTVGGAGCPLPLTVPTPPGGSCPGATVVTFATGDSTALDGVDYTATTTSVELGEGELTKTVSVPVLNNTIGVRTANLFLTNATGGALIGAQGSAVLRIIDVNDSVAFTALGYTVGENGVNAIVGVRRTGMAGSIGVGFVTSPGTASAGSDYTAVTGTVTLPAATALAPITVRTIMVPITNDAAIEGNETFTLRLTGPPALFDASGCDALSAPGTCDTTVTIIDDDQGGVVAFDAIAYTVKEGTPNASILLRRTGGLGGPVTVNFATSDGTAVAPTDYTAVNTTVTFAAGQTAVTALVPIVNNGGVDGTARTVNLALSAPAPSGLPGSPALGAQQTATLTIQDDEPRLMFPTLASQSSPAFTVVEGTAAAAITVLRTGALIGVSVTVTASDVAGQCPGGAGFACAGTDYGTPGSPVGPSTTLTFAAGETSKTFLVPIIDNGLLDGPRALDITLSGAVNAGIVCGLGTAPTCTAPLTIQDDERPGSIAFAASQYTVKEDVAGGALVATITRTAGKASGVTVRWAAVDGTAAGGADYTTAATLLAPASVTFLANETAKTVSIPIANQGGAQGSRTFFLVLCDGSVCGPGPTLGSGLIPPTLTTVTIVDKDAEQRVQFSAPAYSVSETVGSASIMVQRIGTPTGTLLVDFTPAPGTARTLTFAPGVRTQTVAVPIANNALVDGDRVIPLTLDNMRLDGVPTNAITCGGLAGAFCTVPLTVLDDDVAGIVQFSASSYQISEAMAAATIVLQRSGGAASNVTVEVVIDPVSSRLGAPTPNPVTFGPGVFAQMVTIPIVKPNTVDDGDLDVVLRLVNPQNGLALGPRDTAKLTVVDDDTPGVVQFGQLLYTITEPSAPTATATITLTRTGGAASGVTVDYATVQDTRPCPPFPRLPGMSYACAGTNYTATSGTVTFAAGQMSQTFTVAVHRDLAPTGTMPVRLVLANPGGGGTLGVRTTATLNIVDVDAAVGFAAESYSAVEGLSAVITVERTGAAGVLATVQYATANAGPCPAPPGASYGCAGTDYTAKAGTLTFNPGVKTQSFSVPTLANVKQDGHRTFNVTLSGIPAGATLVRSTAVVTIVDNDVAGAIAFTASSFKAPSEFGLVNLSVRRPSSSAAGPVTVAYASVDGTAQAGRDYVPIAGTLTFPPGASDRSLSVTILGNTRDDGNRTFTVELSSPTGGATLGDPSIAAVLITDDDVAGAVQFSVVSFTAPTTCTVAPCKAALVVKRFGGMASGVSVDYATVDGTGNALHDYVPVTDTVSFASGQLLKTIFIELRPGATVGSNFGVVLSQPRGGVVLGSQTTATVTLR